MLIKEEAGSDISKGRQQCNSEDVLTEFAIYVYGPPVKRDRLWTYIIGACMEHMTIK